LGFHAGDDTRREYLLLGDAIPQVGEAIAFGSSGEVVASPQVFQILTSPASSCETTDKEELKQPQVIFSSRPDKFEKTSNLLDPTMLRRPPPESSSMYTRPCLCTLLKDWDCQSLVKLQQRMLLYVHPAVVDGEVFTNVYHNRGASSFDEYDGSQSLLSSSHHDQQILQSEAEIRQVFTVFLQPLIDVNIEMDEAEQVEGTLAVLNQIMVLANRELNRFKGHLRQFILDDMGVVLIANFGLRGSVFPQM
jgi:hypothetical protein